MVVKLCTVCFSDDIDNIQSFFNTFIPKEDHYLVKKNSRQSWVFATNVANDLSPSVYLDLFASHV